METPFFNRQSTWVGILLAGLVAVAVYSFYPKSRLKAENYLPLLQQRICNDTAALFNPEFDSAKLADSWLSWESHNTQVDSVMKHSEKYTLRVELKSEPVAKEFERPSHPPSIRSIPAIYEGKSITVKARMRTEGVEQPIGLLLRIDGSSGTLQFDNMMQKNIMGTEKWKEYSVTLPLPEDAEIIYFGAIISGNGKLWVSDLQVLIDGKDISRAKLKPNTKPASDKSKKKQ